MLLLYVLPKSITTRTVLSIKDTKELKPARLMQKKNKAQKNRPPEMLLYNIGIL